MTDWNHLSEWWLDEVESDAAYDAEVLPLALELLEPMPGATYLDLGCGDGRLMAAIGDAGGVALGVDASWALATRARGSGPVAVCRLPDLGAIGDGTVDVISLVLVMEHVPDPDPVFHEAARIVRPGGALVVVANHPLMTAPGSGPFVDPDDGEVLWRWGTYLQAGSTEEPAGPGRVRFHHHPLGHVLTAAATAGWRLEHVVERGVGSERAAGDPLLAAQAGVPRLLGLRWGSRKEHATR